MRRNVVFIIVFLLLNGCQPVRHEQTKAHTEVVESSVPEGTIVAKINDDTVTLEGLNKEIDYYNDVLNRDQPQKRIATRAQKVEFFKTRVLRQIVLSQEAVRRGLDKTEEFEINTRNAKRDTLAAQLLRMELEHTQDVTDEEIVSFYTQHKDEFKEPDQRHLIVIVVGTEEKSKDVLSQLSQGADFAALAKEYSPQAWDLGYITKGNKFSAFDAAAFSEQLKIGAVSDVFKGPDGYYIVKLVDIKEGKERTLAEMREGIKQALKTVKRQGAIEALMNKLFAESKVEIFEDKIE